MKNTFPKGWIEIKPKITEKEIALAVRDLPKNEAPGPDKIPNEIYRGRPSCHEKLAELFTAMLERAYIPQEIKHFYVAPLDKTGKDPSLCAHKRPIALLSPLMKLLELVLVRRILPIVGEELSPDQYASQHLRSTDTLISDLDRFASTNRDQGEITYVAGLDIAGAFGGVSYDRLVDALLRGGVQPVLVRFIGIWLVMRVFKARLTTMWGSVRSGDFCQTRGVPQGGALSPFMWIIYINKLAEEARQNMYRSSPTGT